ncbi:MAG: hypothetical protein WD512_10065, partial [Candidatus Paceibacterota bacterium]
MNKIKFIVETDDFWIEEGTLNSAIKEHVIRNVKNQILEKISDEVNRTITEVVLNEIAESKSLVIKNMVQEKCKTIKIRQRYSNGEKTIEEAIEYALERNGNVSNDIETYIRKQAEKLGKSLKERYDLQFASHIVKNMQENNLLKEGVFK